MSTQFSDWPTIDKAAGWTTLPKPADSVFKTNVTRNACTVLVKNKIQVDHSDVQSKEQVTEVVTVLDNLDTFQEVMKVDTEKEAADDPVWGIWRQENPISDKSKPDGGGPDCWANDVLISGAAGADEEPQQHPLQGGGVAEQQHQLPGHVGRDQIVHMKDIPGKPNPFPNLIVPLPGRSAHEEEGETGDVREGPVGGAGQQEDDDSGGQGRDHLLCEGGPSNVQRRLEVWPGGQPEQHGGGQHDGDNGGHQVCDGVWDGGVGGVSGGGKKEEKGVLAGIGDGYGIIQQKRRYWKRKSSVPDGLVQRRISQFSVVGQNLGGGGISAKPILNDRKRKWQGPTADDV